jgi:hypothetical protein
MGVGVNVEFSYLQRLRDIIVICSLYNLFFCVNFLFNTHICPFGCRPSSAIEMPVENLA